MLNFLATTENVRKIRSEHPSYNRGKVPKKQREIAIRNFQIRNKTRVEPSYPEIGEETIAKEDHGYSSRTRVNPQWKGGQLGCPNGSDQNFITRVKTCFPD